MLARCLTLHGVPAMFTGNVRNFFDDANHGKGFGFIIPDKGGDDVFAHRHQLVNAYRLIPGDTASYDVELNMRKNKPQAAKVTVTSQQDSGWERASDRPWKNSWRQYPQESFQQTGASSHAWDSPVDPQFHSHLDRTAN